MSSIEVKANKSENVFPYQCPPHREEIDLLEILATLFAARKQTVVIMFLFALAGLAGSFLIPQKWTSQAIVTKSEKKQVIELTHSVTNMAALGVDVKVEVDSIYNTFLKMFDSQELRGEFLAQSPYVKALLDNKEVNKSELNRAITIVSGNFKSQNNSDPKNTDSAPYSSWTLSFTAPDANDAQQLLENYIQFIVAKVKKKVMEDLKNSIDLKISTEKSKLALERAYLENQHHIKVQRLVYSLQVANAAGIKKPVYSNGQSVKDDPDYSVALGADGLTEKLKIEKSINDVAELNAQLQNSEHLLTQLKAIHLGDVNFTPYTYQMQPSLPVKKDGPGKSLIIVLAALLGLLVASGMVLVRHVMGNRMEKEQLI